MALYSITYDLVKDRDYKKLYEGIKEVGNHVYVKPTESQWIIKSNKTAREIIEYLASFVDDDDILFVVVIDGRQWSALNMDKKTCSWLDRKA